MHKVLSVIFISLFISLAFAGFIFSEYSATPATNKVTIDWTTNNENGVTKFTVMRSNDNQVFTEIGSVAANGSGSTYQYIDESVIFKGSQSFYYKLRAVNASGTLIEETEILIVNPNISGMFRTWGAIKALFR